MRFANVAPATRDGTFLNRRLARAVVACIRRLVSEETMAYTSTEERKGLTYVHPKRSQRHRHSPAAHRDLGGVQPVGRRSREVVWLTRWRSNARTRQPVSHPLWVFVWEIQRRADTSSARFVLLEWRQKA